MFHWKTNKQTSIKTSVAFSSLNIKNNNVSFLFSSHHFFLINQVGNNTLPYKCPACSFKQTPNSSSFDLGVTGDCPVGAVAIVTTVPQHGLFQHLGLDLLFLSHNQGESQNDFLKTRAWLSQEFLLAALFDSCPSLQSWLSSALL